MKSTLADVEKAALRIKKFVTFGLGQERYGIEVTRTREIIARYEIVPLPRTPDFIEGIISLRGDIIPVVDLRKRFELPTKERDDESRVIVIEMKEFTVGVQVDRVYEVLKIQEDAIEPPPPLVSGLKADYLDGVAEVKGKLTTILNLEKIFSTAERVALSDLDEAESQAEAIPDEGGEEAEKAVPSVEGKVLQSLPAAVTTQVSEDGMASYCGRSFFIGKKYRGRTVEFVENRGRLNVSMGGEVVKEFEI